MVNVAHLVDDIDGSQRISTPGEDALQLDRGDAWVFPSVPSGSAEELVNVTITDPNGATQTLSQQTLPTNSANTDGEQFVPLVPRGVNVGGRNSVASSKTLPRDSAPSPTATTPAPSSCGPR